MKPPRTDNFAERRQTANDAKKALLEKLKSGKSAGTAKSGSKTQAGKKD